MIVRLREGSDSDPHAIDQQVAEDELVDEAVQLFSSRYGRPVGREEARAMTRRLTAFFGILAEWRRERDRGDLRGAA